MKSPTDSISTPTARKAEFRRGKGMIQEAKAASRKATGIHNRVDRALWPGRKVADVDQVNHPETAGNGCQVVVDKLDAPLGVIPGAVQTDPQRPPTGMLRCRLGLVAATGRRPTLGRGMRLVVCLSRVR